MYFVVAKSIIIVKEIEKNGCFYTVHTFGMHITTNYQLPKTIASIDLCLNWFSITCHALKANIPGKVLHFKTFNIYFYVCFMFCDALYVLTIWIAFPKLCMIASLSCIVTEL